MICHRKDLRVKSLKRKRLQEKLAYILKADGVGELQQCKVSGGNEGGDMRVLKRLMFAHVFEDFSIRIRKVEKNIEFPNLE